MVLAVAHILVYGLADETAWLESIVGAAAHIFVYGLAGVAASLESMVGAVAHILSYGLADGTALLESMVGAVAHILLKDVSCKSLSSISWEYTSAAPGVDSDLDCEAFP